MSDLQTIPKICLQGIPLKVLSHLCRGSDGGSYRCCKRGRNEGMEAKRKEFKFERHEDEDEDAEGGLVRSDLTQGNDRDETKGDEMKVISYLKW